VVVDQPREPRLTTSNDVRRRVAFRAVGAKRVLLHAQAALEDVEGALAAGQYETAVIQARALVMQCLSIRSLAVSGELDAFVHSVSFDPFAGLSPSDIADGLGLLDLDQGEAPAASWFSDLADYLHRTEALLGYDQPLPLLRSPEGTFGALRLAREWAEPMSKLGLPNLLPANWTQPMESSE